MRTTVLAALLAISIGCGDDEGSLTPDAAGADGTARADAPVSADADLTCLSLAPNRWQGMVPMGTVDVGVLSFGAADCLTITQATLTMTGNANETLQLSFAYPVNGPIGQRTVTTDFSETATMTYQAAGGPKMLTTPAIAVSVTEWTENSSGAHDIDIVIDITEAGYTLDPLEVSGTFCTWDALLCSALGAPDGN